ncbi:hypothetical protein [Sulfitobacter sabulilitoris]|uniref:Uncharacterized protein n=1 Tax=Sulfitobacter sabulilitoris TaxID=2562655 RepID=A0A5S3PCM1_9RHOB|nr:hypothetical protein [Sulfitobacter sabulilitoris]TMM51594.1 hypothetical protein FDT80_12600 [Sulfitobacter sabulilitoris]
MTETPRTSPILAGLALLGTGLVLRRWQPRLLDMPERAEGASDAGTPAQRVARKGRDGVATVLPDNMTGAIGRSLIVMGAGLLALRALDLLVDEDDTIF